MMIECEVKSGQTVESIENTRREGSDVIVIKVNRRVKKRKEMME